MACALAFEAVGACVPEAQPTVVVEGGVIAAPVVEGPAALYLTIVNTGAIADTLVSVYASGVGSAAIHRQMPDSGALVRMEPLPELPIPADSAVRMAPGRLHVMLEGDGRLSPGDTVAIELDFRTAGTLLVSVPVVPYQALQEKLASGNATAHH